METHRQRLSQLNSRFKQQRSAAPYLQPVPPAATIYPLNLPGPSRPQPRQQARTKGFQTTNLLAPPATTTNRPRSAFVKQSNVPTVQQSASETLDQKYITLANLTKILHMLQTQVKTNDNETSTVMSSSTTNSAKQRVQQHLQETAMRWWKPPRAPDCPPAPSSISRYNNSPAQSPTATISPTLRQKQQQQENLPLLTIVSNSTRQLTLASSTDNTSSIYDENEISPVLPSKTSTSRLTRHEPVIMATPGKRLHSYDHYKYQNQNPMSFSSQRLIRQT